MIDNREAYDGLIVQTEGMLRHGTIWPTGCFVEVFVYGLHHPPEIELVRPAPNGGAKLRAVEARSRMILSVTGRFRINHDPNTPGYFMRIEDWTATDVRYAPPAAMSVCDLVKNQQALSGTVVTVTGEHIVEKGRHMLAPWKCEGADGVVGIPFYHKGAVPDGPASETFARHPAVVPRQILTGRFEIAPASNDSTVPSGPRLVYAKSIMDWGAREIRLY
ncbi:MAG: hypothetical protein U0Q16_21110 [Bryobacteraceae bacterium]